MKTKLTECLGKAFYDVFWLAEKQIYNIFWLGGGRGSLKTSFVFLYLIFSMTRDVREGKTVHAVVLRKVHNTIMDSVFKNCLWAINLLSLNSVWTYTLNPMVFKYKESTIIFRACHNAEDYQRIKGLKFEKGFCKYGVFEEVTEFTGIDEIDSIQQSIFRGGDEYLCFMMYNPPASRHNWVNIETKLKKPGSYTHSSTYLDAPKNWLGKSFLDKAESIKETNIKRYNHMYLGHEIGEGLEIYPNFDGKEGLVWVRDISDDEIKGFHTIHRGLDFGFTKDASCYVELFLDEAKKILYIFDEVYGHGLTNEMLYMNIKNKSGNGLIYADAAEPRTINELRILGLNIIAADKGKDSKNHGIKWLQGLNLIIIDKHRCPNVVMDFQTYEYGKNKYDEIILEYPKEPHGSAATRYGLCKKIRSGMLLFA